MGGSVVYYDRMCFDNKIKKMRKNIILLTALLREQQFLSCDMIPDSDIICTNDLVEPYERHNIHN